MRIYLQAWRALTIPERWASHDAGTVFAAVAAADDDGDDSAPTAAAESAAAASACDDDDHDSAAAAAAAAAADDDDDDSAAADSTAGDAALTPSPDARFSRLVAILRTKSPIVQWTGWEPALGKSCLSSMLPQPPPPLLSQIFGTSLPVSPRGTKAMKGSGSDHIL